jgi:hypothetical protein
MNDSDLTTLSNEMLITVALLNGNLGHSKSDIQAELKSRLSSESVREALIQDSKAGPTISHNDYSDDCGTEMYWPQLAQFSGRLTNGALKEIALPHKESES